MSWVEKASFEKIKQLLRISERERSHVILLTAENIQALIDGPEPYAVPVIPRPLSPRVSASEHYVINDVPHLLPPQPLAIVEHNPEGGLPAAERPRRLLSVQGSPSRVSQIVKKGGAGQAKKRKLTKKKTKSAGEGLEGFEDWPDSGANLPAARVVEEEEEEGEEEEEEGMLRRELQARLRKRPVVSQTGNEEAEAKRRRIGGSDAEAEESSVFTVSSSPDLSLQPVPLSQIDPPSTSRDSSLERTDQVFDGGMTELDPAAVDALTARANAEASAKVMYAQFLATAETRVAAKVAVSQKQREHIVVKGYIHPKEGASTSAESPIPTLGDLDLIIEKRAPFDKGEVSIKNMRDLYPAQRRVTAMAHQEQYIIPCPSYLGAEDIQQVAEDGMYIRNHNFVQTAELVG